MKLDILATALVLGSTLSTVFAQTKPSVPIMRGFNLGTHDKNGNCKSQAQLKAEFQKIKNEYSANAGFSFTVVKTFTTSDCDLLHKAAGAAKEVGIKLWPTIWAHPHWKFELEKGKLWDAVQNHGSSWLQGVTVGSEHLYRKEIEPALLAQYIWDVKGMVQNPTALNLPKVAVGCADTWTMYEHPDNDIVMRAIDVAFVNAFPYWQGAKPEEGLTKLTTAIAVARSKIYGKPLVVSETGWPTKGEVFNGSVPSVENLQTYWKAAACYLKNKGTSFFWFSAIDEPNRGFNGVEGNFGVADANYNLKISLKC